MCEKFGVSEVGVGHSTVLQVAAMRLPAPAVTQFSPPDTRLPLRASHPTINNRGADQVLQVLLLFGLIRLQARLVLLATQLTEMPGGYLCKLYQAQIQMLHEHDACHGRVNGTEPGFMYSTSTVKFSRVPVDVSSIEAWGLKLIDLLLHLAASVPSSIYIYGDNRATIADRPACGGYLALLHDSCLYVPIASHWCILMISLLDVVCFYDWVISLDQEVALIYPAPWNGVKAAYLFCRYYPMAIAPFHIWGLVGNHEKRVCESYYHVLYACAMPTLLSAQLAPLFFFTKRNACFAISDEPNITVLTANVLYGTRIPAPIAYHMGHWVRGRDTFGPLGKRMLVYVVMTALNTLAICAFLSTYLVRHGVAASSLFANILPSALACRLVLMLRQKASPTETTLRLEYSHMVDNALEMIAVDRCPEEMSEGFTLSISMDAEAQH
ncbi:hypothetical protein EDB83DRAFT_2552791 [Lactarius deliciosus]|nr:hypothetical protein EDB83DRAFT_2552791 [Lactarius deliciosus]